MMKIIIDDEDYDKIKDYTWFVRKNRKTFYCRTSIRNGKNIKQYSLSRFIMSAKKGQMVDHINCNGLDNRKCNLRFCTYSENNRNRRKPKNNKSGFKGVNWDKHSKKWRAHINVHKKFYNLGYFLTPEEGHRAYCEAVKKYHGEYGRIA